MKSKEELLDLAKIVLKRVLDPNRPYYSYLPASRAFDEEAAVNKKFKGISEDERIIICRCIRRIFEIDLNILDQLYNELHNEKDK